MSSVVPVTFHGISTQSQGGSPSCSVNRSASPCCFTSAVNRRQQLKSAQSCLTIMLSTALSWDERQPPQWTVPSGARLKRTLCQRTAFQTVSRILLLARAYHPRGPLKQ